MYIYIYIHTYVLVYIYIYIYTGAAAIVTNFDRLGKKVRPGTFENITVG